MTLNNRIEAFSCLGNILRTGINNLTHAESGEFFSINNPTVSHYEGDYKKLAIVRDDYSVKLQSLINNQVTVNTWFTPENVKMSIGSIANELTEENLVKWISSYPLLKQTGKKKTIGVVMAGNIPLVGFHDFLSVIISGNRILSKTSSKDSELIKLISDILCDQYPELKNDIVFTEDRIDGFDAIIATGSGNSSRYFDFYFRKYPNIIRKNRNSLAIIDGTETDAELERLGVDIFSYFGLGCRNISKLYVPLNYDFDKMIKRWTRFGKIINHNKYANNYDHNKAVFLVNREKFLDKGFLLLKEESGLSSPVAVLHYEYYKNTHDIVEQIDLMRERIQCIIGHDYMAFGQAQAPPLWNYADGIDTIEFLIKLKNSG
jgi:hypothetical protein